MRFARTILERPYKFTIILLVANIFVFILMWQSSGIRLSLLEVFPPQVLIAYGAKLNSLIAGDGQWWRLVTPMFVHVNLLHLLVNMYSLWIVGPYVEKLYGSAKFIVFWVVSGLGALVASYWTVGDPGPSLGPLGRFLFRPDLPSAGASGALFGLVGVLFAFGIKFRHELPEGFKRAFGTGLLPMILLNLFIGYVGSDIFDNAAHLGGLITGAALASLVGYRRPGERASVTVIWRVMQIAAIALVAVSFIRIGQKFPGGLKASTAAPNTSTQSATAENFVTYAKAMNQGQETFAEAVQGNSEGVDEAVKGLDSTPHLDSEADRLKEELKVLLIEVKNLTPAVSTSDKKLTPASQKEVTARFVAWSKNYNQWLKTMGKTHSGLKDQAIPQGDGTNPQ